MCNTPNILHISTTPLVGAPGRIAFAQRLKGYEALSVAITDYPKSGPLNGKFIENTIIASEFTIPLIEMAIVSADVIHVHNDLQSAEWIERLLSLNQTALYVYQVHSPLREGPNYSERAGKIPLPFRARLVVGQYQPRHYPDFMPVPNIVDAEPSVRPYIPGEKLRVIFSPTHKQDGRWNTKHCPELDDAVSALEKLGRIDVVTPHEPVHPRTLLNVRRTCHVTIDEIATGGFHQVSLEGLCAGTVVINRADYFSKAAFAQFAERQLPPFVYADHVSVADTLLELALDPQKTARIQNESFDYFRRYLYPQRLVEVFDAAYKAAE